MQELITRLTEKVGISPDQANKAIDTIKEFVKDKFPMLSGAVDNMFAPTTSTTPGETAPGGDVLDSVKDKLGGMFGG